MTSIPQYLKVLRDLQDDVSRRFGVNLATSSKDTRVAALSGLSVQSILIKILVDKGVISNAELVSAINAVRSSPWAPPDEPVVPVLWDTTPVTGV